MTKIVWTDIAERSLIETLDFIENQWGYNYTNDLIKLIDKRLDQVIKNPSIAPNLFGTKHKRLLIHKHLTIYYELIPSAIKVILVWDNRQNPDKLEKKILK
ncbi:MAG: plasmid stabilization system protein ParE [Flavobacteriales bacterium]|jgi:plasmid stabilization system protein ParE